MRFVIGTLLLFVVALSAPLAVLYRGAAAYRPLAGPWRPVVVDHLAPGERVAERGRAKAAAAPARLGASGWVLGGVTLSALLGALSALAGRVSWVLRAATATALVGLVVVAAWWPTEVLVAVAAVAVLLAAALQLLSACACRRRRCRAVQAGR